MAPQGEYCFACAAKQNLNAPPPSGSLLASTYQLYNFQKHTQPSTQYVKQSVFLTPSTERLQNYVLSASLSGSVVVQPDGHVSWIWLAGEHTGFTYSKGKVQNPTNGIKVVLTDVNGKAHAYPISSTELTTGPCLGCGVTISH